MAQIVIDPDELASAMDIAGLDAEDLRTDYVGRGPTRPCLAYVGPNPQLMAVAIAVAMAEQDNRHADVYSIIEGVAEIGQPSTDQLGLGLVHYWTGLCLGPSRQD